MIAASGQSAEFADECTVHILHAIWNEAVNSRSTRANGEAAVIPRRWLG